MRHGYLWNVDNYLRGNYDRRLCVFRRTDQFNDTFKRIFLNENVRISIRFSLKFYPKSPINNIPALVQIMAWCRSGDKPLSEPVMVRLPTHICVTRPQRVKRYTRRMISFRSLFGVFLSGSGSRTLNSWVPWNTTDAGARRADKISIEFILQVKYDCLLYNSHHAVSDQPFRSNHTKTFMKNFPWFGVIWERAMVIFVALETRLSLVGLVSWCQANKHGNRLAKKLRRKNKHNLWRFNTTFQNSRCKMF